MIEEERTTCWDGNYMKVVAKAHNAPKKKKKERGRKRVWACKGNKLLEMRLWRTWALQMEEDGDLRS